MLSTLHAHFPAVHVLACLCKTGLRRTITACCTELCMHRMRQKTTLQPKTQAIGCLLSC